MSSSICQNIEVVFHWPKHWGCLKFSKSWCYLPCAKNIEVAFNMSTYSGRLPSAKILRSSSISKNIEVVLHVPDYWGCLPFSKILQSSSIFQNIEVVFHFPKYWGRLPFGKKIEVVFQMESAQLVEQVLQSKFCCKKLFWYYSGRVGSDDVDSDNRANSAKFQLKFPTTAELGNKLAATNIC